MKQVDFEEAIKSLRDIGRLSLAYQQFQDRFNEYRKNPLKQKENRKKIDEEHEREDEASKRAEARTKAKDVTMRRYKEMTDDEKAEYKASLKESDEVERAMAEQADAIKKKEDMVMKTLAEHEGITDEQMAAA